MSDHYADPNLFDHCADHHMLKSYVVIFMHKTVVYIYLHSYRNYYSKVCWVSKETLMHSSNTIISHCICHSIVKILYIGNGKRGIIIEELGTEELRCTTLCTTTIHIELYVCILLFVIMNC